MLSKILKLSRFQTEFFTALKIWDVIPGQENDGFRLFSSNYIDYPKTFCLANEILTDSSTDAFVLNSFEEYPL